jgi:hypothetical protein
MRYEDLSLDQRIMLKGAIQTEGRSLGLNAKKDENLIHFLQSLKCLWLFSNFKQCVEMFLFKISL